ncbi:MAG: hypothetical protein GAK31_01070 [Stenotrophomonas maltophilia]|uniref:Transmembrane protein n=1 Tax=Stenotrophomonas maltophilia TaxID=40324 RepID=A0A7V8JM26_STEMA|nr:MAG: hypothetical protein GAK31_01070 [Stenotrophomonas maltophilia]
MLYRGAGLLTLLSPIAGILLLMLLFPDPAVAHGNTSLRQVLLGAALGSAVNVALGLWLNRGPRGADGRARHHLYFMPMQWPALVLLAACLVQAAVKL